MSSSSSPLMFLAHDQWSPRFEKHFFTVRIIDTELFTSAPEGNALSSVPGKNNHPAYYYKIEVSMGKDRHIVYRRYSQFHWLFQQLAEHIRAHEDTPIIMPPKSHSCFFFFVQDEKFAKDRMDLLNDFLEDALQLPRAASDPAVAAFLELP